MHCSQLAVNIRPIDPVLMHHRATRSDPAGRSIDRLIENTPYFNRKGDVKHGKMLKSNRHVHRRGLRGIC